MISWERRSHVLCGGRCPPTHPQGSLAPLTHRLKTPDTAINKRNQKTKKVAPLRRSQGGVFLPSLFNCGGFVRFRSPYHYSYAENPFSANFPRNVFLNDGPHCEVVHWNSPPWEILRASILFIANLLLKSLLVKNLTSPL